MRPTLRLDLVSSPHALENEAMAQSRLRAIEMFFSSQSIPCSRSPHKCAAPEGRLPGVVCQLLLNEDLDLSKGFLEAYAARGEGGLPVGPLQDIASWLTENFQVLRH